MSLTPDKVNELRALRGKYTDVQILSAISAELPAQSGRIDGLISQYGAENVLDEMMDALSYPEREQAFREFAVAAPGEMTETERIRTILDTAEKEWMQQQPQPTKTTQAAQPQALPQQEAEGLRQQQGW